MNLLLKTPLYLFFIGILGLSISRKNVILVMLSIELLFLAIGFFFIIASCSMDDIPGQIYRLAILTVAASESAIGLGILVAVYKLRKEIDLDFLNFIKG